MNSFKSKILFGMLITCALCLPLIIGASYAIYTLEDTKTQETEKEEVKLSTSNIEVDFKVNEYIENTNGRLINPEEVETRADFSLFTIKNTNESSNKIKYSISISEIDTTYDKTTKTYPLMSKDFKWRLVSVGETENLITEGTFEGVETTTFELTKDLDLTLEPTEKITYKLYVWLEESNENQNHLLNRTFKSKISVSSILL